VVTTSLHGHWVEVDGRRDWVPDDQPPSPDGTPGAWHIVGASGELGEWEWHPAPPPILTPPPVPFRAPVAPTGGPVLPGARDPAWNSWRRIGRIFVWWLLLATIDAVLVAVAAALDAVDAERAHDVAAGFAWVAALVALPAAGTLLWGLVQLIPQLLLVTSEVPAGSPQPGGVEVVRPEVRADEDADQRADQHERSERESAAAPGPPDGHERDPDDGP
jgi:hypothetical protein